MMTAGSLASGELGCKIRGLPPGSVVVNSDDENAGLTIHDGERDIQWCVKFFENLHMDLSRPTMGHLESSIER
jgi:hypothetical protein